MYLNYYGLSEKPFSITPDPRFLYLSEKHREGLAHLLYGADEAGSFVVLTGEVGTGKTTLCRRMLSKSPEKVIFALILNPLQTPLELLGSICDEFGIGYPEVNDSRKVLIDALNKWLLEVHARGERTVVIIDEAQNLSVETLEQVRLLTNLETSSEKLLKIILIGQPELKTILERPELRQLNQRITARYHLEPLPENEAANYVNHRLKIAGASRNVFSPAAIRTGYRIAGGIPRIMNLIFDRALTGAYGQDKSTVEPRMVKHAAAEVFNHPDKSGKLKKPLLLLLLAALIAAAGWGALQWLKQTSAATPIAIAQQAIETASAEPVAEPTAAEKSIPTTNVQKSLDPSPEPVAETPINKPFDLNDLLTEKANNVSAFTTLFSLWNLDYMQYEGDSSCRRARNASYRCLFGNGNFQTLREQPLPAVLEMKNNAGKLRQITLNEFDEDSAILEINGEAIMVKESDLAPLWTGNYMMIWPTPPGERLPLQPGDTGPAVRWLKQQLNKLSTTDQAISAGEFYNDQLRRQVLRFQLDQGLAADGIAGEQTLIKLATAIYNRNKPALSRN